MCFLLIIFFFISLKSSDPKSPLPQDPINRLIETNINDTKEKDTFIDENIYHPKNESFKNKIGRKYPILFETLKIDTKNIKDEDKKKIELANKSIENIQDKLKNRISIKEIETHPFIQDILINLWTDATGELTHLFKHTSMGLFAGNPPQAIDPYIRYEIYPKASLLKIELYLELNKIGIKINDKINDYITNLLKPIIDNLNGNLTEITTEFKNFLENNTVETIIKKILGKKNLPDIIKDLKNTDEIDKKIEFHKSDLKKTLQKTFICSANLVGVIFSYALFFYLFKKTYNSICSEIKKKIKDKNLDKSEKNNITNEKIVTIINIMATAVAIYLSVYTTKNFKNSIADILK